MAKTPLMNNLLRDPVYARSAYRVVDKILDHWRMDDVEKALMLGVEDSAYRVIKQNKKMPATEEMLLRVSDTIAIFRILSTMYDFDHHTVGRIWIKRKNWRAPFYGDRPIDHIERGYLALEATRRHLEALITSYGGVRVGKESVVIGEIEIGEIVAFNNFALIQNEDADILATMLLRVCDEWKLSAEEVIHFTEYEILRLREVAEFHFFPNEESLTLWRTILMIHYAVLVLQSGNKEAAYGWMRTSNIMLKNGMTPLCAIKNGELYLVYELLKPLVEYMP